MRFDFDLECLRRQVAPFFRDYDEAVRQGDCDRAYAAKMSVTRTALSKLKKILPNPDCRGLYLFAGQDEELAQLRYIGKSSPGTLYKRIEKRLRDETCLDAKLYGCSREDVWVTAYSRMCLSMGQANAGHRRVTAPETLLRYAFDHMKTTALFKDSTRVIFFVSEAEPAMVKAAEALLIYSAVSGGAPLLNIQERDNLLTDFSAGVDLAIDVIQQAGIETAHWHERAKALLGRFDGQCC